MNTPQRLRELREKSGMTPQQVANAIGVDRTTITKYETGGSKPTRSLQKLAELYNVSTDYILGNDVPTSSAWIPMSKSNNKDAKEALAWLDKYERLDIREKETINSMIDIALKNREKE